MSRTTKTTSYNVRPDRHTTTSLNNLQPEDSGTEANCTFVMYNMTSADIVNDVP